MRKRTPAARSPWQGTATKARTGRGRGRTAPSRSGAPSVTRPPISLRFIWRFLPGSWRGRAKLAFSAAVSVGAVLVLVGIGRSGLMDVRGIEVAGAVSLNDRVLIERSGLKGENILTADMGAAERRLRALPLVADVDVRRTFPLGARIHVTEREPWAVWERGGRRSVIDKDGVVLEGIDIPSGAPLISDARQAEAPALMKRVPAEAAKTVRQLVELMPATPGLTPRAFRFEDERGLIVTATDGRTAILGDSSGIEYKLSVWSELLKSAERGDLPRDWVGTVDLRYGSRPSLVNAIDLAKPAPTATPNAAKTPASSSTTSPTPAARQDEQRGTTPRIRLETAPTPTPADLGFAAGDVNRSTSRNEGGNR